MQENPWSSFGKEQSSVSIDEMDEIMHQQLLQIVYGNGKEVFLQNAVTVDNPELLQQNCRTLCKLVHELYEKIRLVQSQSESIDRQLKIKFLMETVQVFVAATLGDKIGVAALTASINQNHKTDFGNDLSTVLKYYHSVLTCSIASLNAMIKEMPDPTVHIVTKEGIPLQVDAQQGFSVHNNRLSFEYLISHRKDYVSRELLSSETPEDLHRTMEKKRKSQPLQAA